MNTLIFTPFNVGFYQSHSQSKDIAQEKITAQDFVVMANALPDKRFELIDGQIIAMANTKPRHNLIMNNLSWLFQNHFRNNEYPCHFFSDIACKIDEYNCPQPDILVVCNDSIHKDLLEYPTLVGEIFSSNRENDIKKLVRYKNCPSIFEILMIEQTKAQITVHRRGKFGRWSDTLYKQGDEILLDSINLTLRIDDIYQKVVFDKQ